MPAVLPSSVPPPSRDIAVASRYRLAQRLGSGGMGTVWAAHDEVLRRDVAVKEVLPPDGLSPRERAVVLERTRREARAAAAVASPSVMTVYDVIDDDERTWIVMERLPRRTLADVLTEEGPVPVHRAAGIALAVLDALDAAHAVGVLHRDVKPANVMWGPGGRIVLADFGIARTAGEPSLTEVGMVLGSPAYLAPERARGGAAAPAADLWSLGALLFAAVEGRAPFGGAGALATLTSIVADDVPPAPSAGLLGPVVEGLLRKDPERRMTSAQARPLLERAALARPTAAGGAVGAPGAVAASGVPGGHRDVDDSGTTAASPPLGAGRAGAAATTLEPVVRHRRRALAAAAGAGALAVGVLSAAGQLAPALVRDVAVTSTPAVTEAPPGATPSPSTTTDAEAGAAGAATTALPPVPGAAVAPEPGPPVIPPAPAPTAPAPTASAPTAPAPTGTAPTTPGSTAPEGQRAPGLGATAKAHATPGGRGEAFGRGGVAARRGG